MLQTPETNEIRETNKTHETNETNETPETRETTFFNDEPFYITIVEDNEYNTNELDWNNPNYVHNLISQPFIKSVLVSSNNFFDYIGKFFNANDNNLYVTETIGEEPLHNYQIIYIDKMYNNNKVNYFASIINTNNEVIYGKAVFIKNYVSTLTDEIKFVNMDSDALHKMIKKRGLTTFVIWDDENETWIEEENYGVIDTYAKKYFEDTQYKTCEIAFLKHNLNILYVNSDYGKSGVCGTLLNGKVDKVLIFTKLTDDVYGNITKEEIHKIIKLSTVLKPPFTPDNKWLTNKKDKYNRTIINNKYRILDNIYQENFKL